MHFTKKTQKSLGGEVKRPENDRKEPRCRVWYWFVEISGNCSIIPKPETMQLKERNWRPLKCHPSPSLSKINWPLVFDLDKLQPEEGLWSTAKSRSVAANCRSFLPSGKITLYRPWIDYRPPFAFQQKKKKMEGSHSKETRWIIHVPIYRILDTRSGWLSLEDKFEFPWINKKFHVIA